MPQKIDFLVSTLELALMEKVAGFEPWLVDIHYRARKCDGKWKVRFDMEELHDCRTALVAQATFPGEPNVQELRALAERLNTYLKMNGFVNGKTPYSQYALEEEAPPPTPKQRIRRSPR